ncbi:unnamed protein product [Mytilus coruscus]|uniref:IRG-type G domain-containing protein n=1 Tax=Mytilus coruscus TaxID=42192 RepID=A0A6J8DCA2_MYTCO|nr:unnamed protein product [Mytilus coruscus]
MNPERVVCSGIKDGKTCSKLVSNESAFCLDFGSSITDNVPVQSSSEPGNESTGESDSSESQDDGNRSEKWDLNEHLKTATVSDVSTNSSVQKRCKNCGHNIRQDQMFCDKCGNKLGDVCIGKINGIPCSKFVSYESKFCAHCGTANIEKNSGKTSCKSCGHDIHKTQKFCDNCGFKIGATCLGKINGNPCATFLSYEIKFCANCGTANPDYIAAQFKSKNKDEISSVVSNDSIIQLTSMGYTGEQAMDALKCYGGHLEEAVDWLLNLPTDDDTTKRTKPPTDDDRTKRTKPATDVDKMNITKPPTDEERMNRTKPPTIDTMKSTKPPSDDDIMKRTKPPTDDDTMKRTKPLTDYDTMPRTKIPTDEDTMTKTKPLTEDDRRKKTKPPTEDDRMTRTNPPTNEEIMKRTKSSTNEDTMTRTKTPTDDERMKKTKPPTDNDRMTRKQPPIDGDTMKKTKPPTGDETMKGTKPSADDDTIKRTKPPTDDDIMKRTKPTADEKKMKRTKSPTNEDTKTKTKPPTDDDRMKKTKPLTDDDRMKRKKPPTDEDTMTKMKSQTDDNTMKKSKPPTDDRMKRTKPPTDDDRMKRTKPALSEGQIHQKCKEQISLKPSHESVMQLTSAGFTEKQAIDALKCTDGNEEVAVKWLLRSVPDYNMEQMKVALTEVDEEIRDSDEERVHEFFAAATDLSSESTSEALVEIESRGNIENDILNRLQTDGVIATAKFLMVQAMKWKRAKVKIAVAGQSSAGKSAFINAIRGVNYKDEGYAKEGFGDTTLEVETYLHPSFKQMIYCDLPGYGTTTITREKFLEKVNIRDYDIFIIFFSCVPTTDDEWLVRQLQEAKIPFCFARTKLDQDIENGKRMGKSEKTVLNEIMDAIAKSTESMPVLKDEQVFIISNHKPSVGDMSKLVKFMQQKVTTVKFETILFSIPAFTEEIIEKNTRIY